LPKRREFRPLEPSLLKPKSVAVIGASQNPEKVGYALVRNLESFKGKVFPVNPKYRELLGFKCYSSVKEIPEEVDCALVAVPARSVPQVVRECGEKGVKLVVVISAGFREVGNKELEREVVEIARRFGVRLLGPNTLGFIVPGISLNASFSSITPPEGEIAFLSQSGALITAVIDASVEERIGFSLVASLGNQADVELTELFWVAVREPETKVVLSYVEGVELGKELLELVNKKPSVFIKVGRGKGGKRAAASHTGSLARDYKLFKDAVEAKGGIVVDSISEAFDCCELLRAYGRIRGKGLVIVTNAGGPGALCADYAEELGLELVDISPIEKELSLFLPDNWSRINPIDLIGDATSKRYRDAFNVLVKFKEWHSCVVVVTPQAMTDVPRIAQEIVRFKELSQRAVVALLMGGHSVKLGREILKGAGVPTYDEPLRALKAIRRGVWSGQS
jgi:acetyl coenzyme A synthetase (ADP forming)-like protein